MKVMKKLGLVALSILSINGYGAFPHEPSGPQVNLRFWDGSFAYNELNVVSTGPTNRFLDITLKGAELKIGHRIEGNDRLWGQDNLHLTLRVEDCSEISTAKENQVVVCEKEQAYVTLSWRAGANINKTYSGPINNIKIEARHSTVEVSFKVPSDDDFKPAQEDIDVSFAVLGNIDFKTLKGE